MTPITKMTDGQISEIVSVFKSLADNTRLKIMQVLHDDEMCVSDIVVKLKIQQASVSKHLKILTHAGLLTSRREGTTIYYSISDESVNKICSVVCDGYQRLFELKLKSLKRK